MAVVWFSRTFDHEQRIGCELPASNCAEITGSLHVKFCRATSARYNNGRPPACWIATCFRNGYKPWLSKHVQKKIYCEPFFKGNGLFSSYLLEIRWCAHYDCDALWIQNFQDGGEGREISQVICFIFQ